MKNKVVIIGCGRLGASIASYAASQSLNVIVVDSNPAAFERLEEPFSGFTVAGDATDQVLLEREAYIQTAESAIVTTGNDNVNLYLAHLLSRIYEVPEIVVRFDDPKYQELIKDLKGVNAVYPFQLSFEKILSYKEVKEDAE